MNKKQLNFRSCSGNLEQIPTITEQIVNSKDYVYLGVDNDLPSVYFNAYNECSILQSVINATVDYISGSGIDIEDKVINRQKEKLTELIEKITLDYIIYGAFSIQVIKNKLDKIAELNYIDVRNVRLNEKGDYVYYNKGWGKYARNITKYHRYADNQANSILYVKNPKSKGVYGLPLWSSALRDIYTLIEASKNNFSNMVNGFSPNVLISFNNGVPTEDIQDEIEDLIKDKYTSSSGSKIMITWSDSKETAPEINSFSTEDYTARYEQVINSSRNAILSAFRVSGQLVGVLPEQTGFNSVEYENSFKVFQKTVINPIQKQIEKAFARLDINFKLNEFNIDWDNQEQEVIE